MTMIRVLQSPWFAAALGCLLYLATTAAVLKPSKFAAFKPPEPDYSAEDDPSWKFRNPEMDQWLAQIKSERDKLDLREEHLDELQTRLNSEMQELSDATQTVSQLQLNFNRSVISFSAQEIQNIKHQAKLMSEMSPQGAIDLLEQMPDDDAVRILYTMKDDVASPILETWSKSGTAEAKRAADLTEKLRQISTAPPAAPPPP
jgi:flagellar motility protein MotE (MotC chaperone)